MKCSPGISNFLEDISRFSHSIVFFYFFTLVTEKGFLISPCYLRLTAQLPLNISETPVDSVALGNLNDKHSSG